MRNLIAHGMLAEKLLRDPSLIDRALATLSEWKQKHGPAPALTEWRELLESHDLHSILAKVLALDETGMRMRSSSPFAGLLTEDERALAYSLRTR